jgi:hypothetical protein
MKWDITYHYYFFVLFCFSLLTKKKWGKYGPALEAEAKRIEGLPLPDCIYLKNKHVRYRCVTFLFVVFLPNKKKMVVAIHSTLLSSFVLI